MVKGMKQKKIAIDQLNYAADIRGYYYQVKVHTLTDSQIKWSGIHNY